MAEPLTTTFWNFAESSIASGRSSLHHGFVLDAEGKLLALAMALDGEEVYRTVLRTCIKERASSAIFALDRYAKAGQGTRYGDLLAGHWLTEGDWRPFIIEYQVEPRIVEPVDFGNAFWNAALRKEMAQAQASLLGRAGERAPASHAMGGVDG